MIQRIQTVYLFLGALALGALLFFDAIWESAAARAYDWFAPTVLLLSGMTAVLALGTIFLYKNRALQLKVVLVVQVLTVLLTLILYGGMYLAGALDEGLETSLLIALLLPAAAYVLFYFARRGIVHDMELVRSMDRLRG